MPLQFEKETYLLRRCFFEVQNEVGKGRREEAYHRACELWFQEHRLPVVSKAPHRLFLRGEEALCLFPDFVGWDKISIELKALPRRLNRSELVQLFDYLKFRRDRLGLLVNMGLNRVEIERVIFNPSESEWVENWTDWTNHIQGDDRATGLAIREALRALYAEHTTGYGSEIVGKLVQFALKQQRLGILLNPLAKAYFRRVEIDESALACIVINKRVLLTMSALFDTNEFNIHRGRSYLKALGLQWGIAADFGKTKAEIVGFRLG
jgi:GxxExxY protein